MRTGIQSFVSILFLVVLTFSCTPDKKATGTPPVVQLMPDLPGYHVVEGRAIQDFVAALAQGTALLAGHPELASLISKLDGFIACYQDVGALNTRIYSDEDFPLSAGAIAIADRDRLLDPQTLFRCVGGRVIPFSGQPELNPCSHSYTLQQGGNEFYFIYAGTTLEICHTFCVNLEGCSAH